MTLLALLLRILLTLGMLAAVLRLTGKRGWQHTRPLDLIIAFVLGNVGHDLIIGQVLFTEGLLAVGAVCWIHLLVTLLAQRSTAWRSLVFGHPLVLVQKGSVQRAVLRREGIDYIQLEALLHLQGIDRLTEVEEVRVNTDGTVQIRRKSAMQPLTNRDLIIAPPAEDESWRRAA